MSESPFTLALAALPLPVPDMLITGLLRQPAPEALIPYQVDLEDLVPTSAPISIAEQARRALLATIERTCRTARDMGPGWLVAVSPPVIDGDSFALTYNIAIVQAVGPDHDGWTIYGPWDIKRHGAAP